MKLRPYKIEQRLGTGVGPAKDKLSELSARRRRAHRRLERQHRFELRHKAAVEMVLKRGLPIAEAERRVARGQLQ